MNTPNQFDGFFKFFSKKPDCLSKARKGKFNLKDSYVTDRDIEITIEVPDPLEVLFVTDFGLTLFYAGDPVFSDQERIGSVLDIGFGCGIYPIVLEKIGFQNITGIDINPEALPVARHNISINKNKASNIRLKIGSFPDDLDSNGKYDLIISNSSHLPSVKGIPHKKGIDYAILGGEDGRSMLDAILENADRFLAVDGRMLILHSSLCGLNKTIQKTTAMGYAIKCLFDFRMQIPFFAYPNEREILIKKELVKLRTTGQAVFNDEDFFWVHVIEIKRHR